MPSVAADALSLRRYGPSPGSHSHDHFQVLFGLEGTLELEIEGRGQRVALNEGCVIEPGARHDFEANRGSLCLVLDSTAPGWGQCLQRTSALPSTARPLARYLASALLQGRPLAQAHGPALLLEAWLADTAEQPGSAAAIATGQPTHLAVSRRRSIDWPQLQQWAAREWHRELTVADLAARVHLSPSQFTARCRDELGLGAIEWLRHQRLAHARLLRASGMAVAAVARSTGYRSPSALTAALRRAAQAGQGTLPHPPHHPPLPD